MKIGGYQIIDLKGKNLTTDVGMVYEGIYELIEGTRKPILLSGIQVDDTEYQDVFTSVTINGSAFELKAYNKIFTIEDTDVVTVTNDSESGNGGSVDGDITKFYIFIQNENYEGDLTCEAPANKTWRECIINGLIKVTGWITNYDNDTLTIGIGEPTDNTGYDVSYIKIPRNTNVYFKFKQTDLPELSEYLRDKNDRFVKENDIITSQQYRNYYEEEI